MSVAETRADQALQDARERDAEAVDLGSFDVEGLADYLEDECRGCSPVELRPQLRDVTAADFDGEPASEVLAIACDAGQPDKTRLAALDALIAANEAYRARQRAESEARAHARAIVRQWTRRAAA